MRPLPLIDHVIINARDQLDAVAETYSRLGFTLTPRGYHSLGSINHLAILGTDYLELLGVPPGGDGRSDVLDWPAGLNGVVFKTYDSDALFAGLQDAGAPVLPPQLLSRPVDLGGTTREAAFRNVRVAPEAVPAGRMFFCHHLTPELVWRDEWRRHPNGAVGVAGAVIAADDPATVADLFSLLFGPDPVRRSGAGCKLITGLATVEVVTPSALASRFGPAAPDAAGRRQFMAALILRTASLERTRASVPGAEPFEDGLLVPADAAGGAALMFKP